jgi:hypothetical protein
VRSGLFVLIPLVISLIVILFGFVSVLRIPEKAWLESNRRRRNWVLLMVFFGPLAVLLFYATIRYELLDPERYHEIDGVSEDDL